MWASIGMAGLLAVTLFFTFGAINMAAHKKPLNEWHLPLLSFCWALKGWL